MREKRADFYQITLILLAVVITGLFGVFIYRELFPEYKVYQNRYVELEELRSETTGIPPAPYKSGVAQIVIAKPDLGPETIDRCVSCHTALKLPHFSPTTLAYDVNGSLIVDSHGAPVTVPNDEYVWGMIDRRIASLLNDDELAQLTLNGDRAEVKRRTAEAEGLAKLKTSEVHGHHIDMTRVLAMHPLIGRETAPFQYHSMDDFGCTSCHSGNGRGLTTSRAHGPVLDGQYHAESHGFKPKFLEEDPENDPLFAKVFNDKPGHDLLFQTTPLLTGALLEAKCVQCHTTGERQLQNVTESVDRMANRRQAQLAALQKGLVDDEQTVATLLGLHLSLKTNGYQSTLDKVRNGLQDLRISDAQQESLEGHITYLTKATRSITGEGEPADRRRTEMALEGIEADLTRIVGSKATAIAFTNQATWNRAEREQLVVSYLSDNPGEGAYSEKKASIEKLSASLQKLDYASSPLKNYATAPHDAPDGGADIHSYTRGEELFLSQACYACHKIGGLTRGGVGPELSDIGLQYPWYVKESIVWPQGNLPTSTMPNFKLDHEELEDLMTFLMAQRGETKIVSEVDKAMAKTDWEAGAPMPWEKPISPSDIERVDSAKLTFATEGCASCHKLRGFSSSVGFTAEKGKNGAEVLAREKEWFRTTFPQYLTGSQIVQAIDKHSDEIQKRISAGIHEKGTLDQIDEKAPDGVASYLSNFKYAFRAKNASLAAQASKGASHVEEMRSAWHEQVNQVMMMFVQEYGLGRDIGPHLHWSGVYRDEQWLVEHFRKPTMHVAKSIMPTLPFHDSKFYQLTNMLQKMAAENRDRDREVVEKRGFDPEHAYDQHCASCHGQFFHGNGPIARWIYPIPKNLRNPTFMRNLTRERVTHSITHGVKGTPMPPWGEDAVASGAEAKPILSSNEIDQLVDWLFLALPGGRVIESDEDVQKWNYQPEDFLRELEDQGVDLDKEEGLSALDKVYLRSVLPNGQGLYVSTNPTGYTPENPAVKELFDVVVNGKDAPEPRSYYLKESFFSAENIHAGEGLFIANCSHCHGKEGGGNGDRATTMVDAKPRMLTNLPWLETRDDLRLLRSIKFGVPGTAMTPWGDKTSAWQRLQIVTYIRSLTADKAERLALNNALYKAFERSTRTIEKAQVAQDLSTSELNRAYTAARAARERAHLHVQGGSLAADRASEAYESELILMQKLKQQQGLSGTLADLSAEVLREKKLFGDLGATFIDRDLAKSQLSHYYQLVANSGGRFEFANGELRLLPSVEQEKSLQSSVENLDRYLKEQLASFAGKSHKISAKLPSAERTEALQQLKQEGASFEKMRRELLSTVEQVHQVRKSQKRLFDVYSKWKRERT